MIAALAEAGAVLERADYVDGRARPARTSCCASCATRDGRLLRTYKDGRAQLDAYLEDHAFLLEALLVLYEATFDAALVRRGARQLADTIDRRASRDAERGGFFSTADDHERARRAAQGPRGHADPVRQLERRARAAAARAR